MGARPRDPRPGDTPGQPRRNRIREDLARLGVADEVSAELSRRLAAFTPRLSPEAYDAALAGAALAHGMHRDVEHRRRRNVRDVHDIQRMLAGFADELRKVDEALRILSTYVTRMRSRSGSRSGTLH